MAPVSWLLVRHFALILSLKVNLKQVAQVGTSLLVALTASFLNESCDSDAKNELLSGLVDNLGTTRGTKLSVLHTIVFPSFVNRGF